ncbi:hypothetical protein MBANPS3_006286 [Mucor bainieri]
MPKVMKGMLIKLVSVSPTISRTNWSLLDFTLVVIYKLKTFVLDCPTEYITRYDATMDDVFLSTIASQLHRQLSVILNTFIGARIIMETTASKLATDTTRISVGKTKINSIGKKMIPCFNPGSASKKRKRDQS